LLAGLIFALATLTRPEGAMLLALAVFHAGCVVVVGGLARGGSLRRPQALLRDFWPTALPMVLVYAALIVPFFIWRFSYYGDLLPNTFYVKTGGGPRVWLRGLAYLGSFALEFGGPLLILAPLALAARPSGADRGPRMEDEGQAPARPWSFVLRLLAWPAYLLLLCAAYAGYVVVVGGDHFPGHRFLVPIVPWLALLIAGGMAVAFRWLTRPRALRLAAPAILGLVLVLYSSYALTRSARYDVILAGNDESLWIWAEIGEWLRDNTAPEETVAAAGAGAIAYYSDRTAIDLLGLTERHIARLPVPEAGAGTAGHEKQDPVYVLEVRRPTYIPRIWDDYFGGEDSLRGTYELITVRTRHGRQIELWRRLP
ncbi:MAG: hypothetical protein RLZZ387_1240, partial [Chloroflexota bacterium]